MKNTLNPIPKISNYVFQNIHTNNLIYNTCWEDPRCDRQLLEIKPDSRVVMITSAGCNALDYALDNPTEINCVDMNLRQNALLDLKKAAIEKEKTAVLHKQDRVGTYGSVYLGIVK